MFQLSKRYELCGALGGMAAVTYAALSAVCETLQPAALTADELVELEHVIGRIRVDLVDLANLTAKLTQNTDNIPNLN